MLCIAAVKARAGKVEELQGCHSQDAGPIGHCPEGTSVVLNILQSSWHASIYRRKLSHRSDDLQVAFYVAWQALQDILDDDEDIAAMYLGRKAAAREAAAARSDTGGDATQNASQDDELLVAEALVHSCWPDTPPFLLPK